MPSQKSQVVSCRLAFLIDDRHESWHGKKIQVDIEAIGPTRDDDMKFVIFGRGHAATAAPFRWRGIPDLRHCRSGPREGDLLGSTLDIPRSLALAAPETMSE